MTSLDDDGPLAWWRGGHLKQLDHEQAAILRALLGATAAPGLPDWELAAAGDVDAALELMWSDPICGGHAPLYVDLVASALLRCALEGSDEAARAVHDLRMVHCDCVVWPHGHPFAPETRVN